MLTCRNCGIPLTGSARKLCSTWWPLIRDAGIDPTSTPEALNKRRQSALVVKAAEAAWAAAGSRSPIGEAQLYEEVLARLQQVTVRQIQDATGLSSTACSMIRSGKRTAHPRHWAALAELASSLPAT